MFSPWVSTEGVEYRVFLGHRGIAVGALAHVVVVVVCLGVGGSLWLFVVNSQGCMFYGLAKVTMGSGAVKH